MVTKCHGHGNKIPAVGTAQTKSLYDGLKPVWSPATKNCDGHLRIVQKSMEKQYSNEHKIPSKEKPD